MQSKDLPQGSLSLLGGDMKCLPGALVELYTRILSVRMAKESEPAMAATIAPIPE